MVKNGQIMVKFDTFFTFSLHTCYIDGIFFLVFGGIYVSLIMCLYSEEKLQVLQKYVVIYTLIYKYILFLNIFYIKNILF